MSNFLEKLKCINTTVGLTIVLIICVGIIGSGLALGIADLVIGIKYLQSECSIENLANYLIVLGPFCIINFIILIIGVFYENINKKINNIKCLFNIMAFITYCICIWGMTLVWDTDGKSCPNTLYNYAYYRTVVFIFIGVAILTILISGLTISCCYFCIVNCCYNQDANHNPANPKSLSQIDDKFDTYDKKMNDIDIMLNTVLNTVLNNDEILNNYKTSNYKTSNYETSNYETSNSNDNSNNNVCIPIVYTSEC